MQPLEYQPGGSAPPVAGEQPPPGLLAKLGRLFGDEPAAPPPNPYTDVKAITDFVEECKKEALENRWVYERTWWRIMLYVLGPSGSTTTGSGASGSINAWPSGFPGR